MALTCVVKSCSNGAYWLNKWKKLTCDNCGCLHKEIRCKCDPPFRLFPFPTVKKDVHKRERWKQLIGRKSGQKLWSPSKDSRVCSQHFVDGQPTILNPLPTLNLGYDGSAERVRRMNFFDSPSMTKAKKCNWNRQLTTNVGNQCEISDGVQKKNEACNTVAPEPVPWYIWFICVMWCLLQTVINCEKKVVRLTKENETLRAEIKKLKNKKYVDNLLQSDADVKFYTGLNSKSVFDKLHGYIAPLLHRRWTGVRSMAKNVRKFCKIPNKFGPERKISSKSEFLLTLMKLRLGLLNRDLAKRFDISETLCSRIFFAWIRASSSVLQSLVYMPDEETLIASNPERFRHLPDLNSIIDCTEVFIETPKDLYLQGATWSDYKHHNTIKFLIACAPNSAITYVSPAYTGRISDKALTMDCGFLDDVPPYSLVMADKGFNIADECAVRNISLYVPPGKRGRSQMTVAAVNKTKKIANHRIIIEQVIRRLKTFRILQQEFPLSLLGHTDDIVKTCSGICNLKEPIYKT